MTLKRKIQLSNLLMVLIPIVISCVGIFLIAKTSMGSYWNTLEAMYINENGLQSAQSLIYTYKMELWENNWDSREFLPNREMTNLERTLADMGYFIQVKMNGEVLYSSIQESDMRAAEALAGDALYTAKSLTACEGELTVIKYTFYRENNICSVIAVSNGTPDHSTGTFLRDYILRYLAVMAVIFFVMVELVNLALSRWISSSVLGPLNHLSAGAREIRNGNLDYEIRYEKRDEFGEVCRDFNEMRGYLKQSVEQRQEFERRRQELITRVSHDLRTPLTSIKGYLEGILEGIAETPEKQTRYLNAIRVRAGDLERLVDSLSVYSRLGNRAFAYQRKPGDMREFLERYVESSREPLRRDRVTVRIFGESETYPVMMDEDAWRRVFDNLFANTVRYRKKQASAVTIQLEKKGGQTELELTFADDGPGVPGESLERIFDQFYRTDEARTHAGNGSGIGLAIVREIVKGHGGRVRAENQNGLAIIMTIPMQAQETDEIFL